MYIAFFFASQINTCAETGPGTGFWHCKLLFLIFSCLSIPAATMLSGLLRLHSMHSGLLRKLVKHHCWGPLLPSFALGGELFGPLCRLAPLAAPFAESPQFEFQMRPYSSKHHARGFRKTVNARQLESALTRLVATPRSRRTPREREQLARLVEVVTTEAGSFRFKMVVRCVNVLSRSPEHLSDRTVWVALAKAATGQLTMAKQATKKGPFCPSSLVALSVNGFSKINFLRADRDMWEVLADAAVASAPKMNPQDVANCVNGCSKVEVLLDNLDLWMALSKASILSMREMTPQHIANCVNGLSKVEQIHPYRQLWKALEWAVLSTINWMTPQGIANCVNGFSKGDPSVRSEALWKSLAKAAISVMHQMNPQDVANCVNGFSKAPQLQGNQALWEALGDAAVAVEEHMNAQGVANCVHGFSQVEIMLPNRVLWEVLSKAVVSRLQQMTRLHVAGCAVGFSKVDFLLGDLVLWDALKMAAVSLKKQALTQSGETWS